MQFTELKTNKIKSHDNTRVDPNDKEIAQLMSSIKQNGLINPIGVKRDGDEFVIVHGNRRFQAMTKLGWSSIPVGVIDIDTSEEEMLTIHMSENLQRKDLSEFELGRGFQTFIDEYKLTPLEIASRVSMPVKRVKDAIQTYKTMPEQYGRSVKFYKGRNKSNLSPSLAMKALNIKKSFKLGAEGNALFELVKTKEINGPELKQTAKFMQEGYSLSESIKKSKTYKVIRVDVMIRKSDIEFLETKYKTNINDILRKKLSRDPEVRAKNA